jgi:hypothetical protein
MCGIPVVINKGLLIVPQTHKLFKHIDCVTSIAHGHCRQLVMNIKFKTLLESINFIAKHCSTTLLPPSLSTQITLKMINAQIYTSTTR